MAMPTAAKLFVGIAIVFATFLAGGICAQSPLDASGEKKVTVGSEIYRGHRAMLGSLSSQSGGIGISSYLLNTEEAVSENRQKQSDADGFMLGARFSQWLILDFALNRGSGPSKYDKPKEIAGCQSAALKYFIEARELQKKLRVDDSSLFQALKLSDSQQLAKIEERLKAYESLK